MPDSVKNKPDSLFYHMAICIFVEQTVPDGRRKNRLCEIFFVSLQQNRSTFVLSLKEVPPEP